MTDKTTTTKQIPVSESTGTKAVPLAFTVDPTSGPEQTPLTITGKDFGNTVGTIRLHEVSAPALTWSDSTITTIVPYGTAPTGEAKASAGDLVVRTVDGRSAAAEFTVTTPESAEANDDIRRPAAKKTDA